jgi:predicted ATPase
MLLQQLEIYNFRSLESVKLEKLGLSNVLIGRNNSGKSSVFGALALLNNVIRGQDNADWNTVLTGKSKTLSLEIRLRFETSRGEQEEFISLLWPGAQEEKSREAARNSALLRQIEFLFKSPPGKPNLLHLRETKTLGGDGQWAVIQKMIREDQELSGNPESLFKRITDQALTKRSPIQAGLLDIGSSTENFGVHLSYQFVSALSADNQFIQYKASAWPLILLEAYLRKAFFFSPFRHSEAKLEVAETELLSQSGSNLAQVLHTINSNNRPLFIQIEQFVQAALPDIGILQPPVRGKQTEVGFLSTDGGYFVRLHDMGGGIEQLLMVSVVLLTTGEENTLFLEEPESHLHVGAQRFLIERLHAGKRQVFITTHSPTFVNLSHPSSMYQVKYAGNRTTIARLDGSDTLSAMLADIGSRNSDVLLSNAVLFVEGPGDRDTFSVWSKTLSSNLEEHNITLFPMGGGEHSDRKAKVRSDVLTGISQKAPVPHLFVLDRDERSEAEVDKLQGSLGAKVHLLQRRELENYLLVPRALLAALREKCSSNPQALQQIDQTKEEEIFALIRAAADSLYGLVLLKRIRAEIGGLAEGLLPRASAIHLAIEAGNEQLPQLIASEIERRFGGHLKSLDVPTVVNSQKEALDKDWSDIPRRLDLAPGEELLAAVFQRFGTEYKKPEDTVRIASKMTRDEIPKEIKELVKKTVELPASS